MIFYVQSWFYLQHCGRTMTGWITWNDNIDLSVDGLDAIAGHAKIRTAIFFLQTWNYMFSNSDAVLNCRLVCVNCPIHHIAGLELVIVRRALVAGPAWVRTQKLPPDSGRRGSICLTAKWHLVASCCWLVRWFFGEYYEGLLGHWVCKRVLKKLYHVWAYKQTLPCAYM